MSGPKKDLSAEWLDLCQWFKTKASEAVLRTKSRRAEEIILLTVAAFCRDEPPGTIEGLAGWSSFAKRHVDLWENSTQPDSDADLPMTPRDADQGRP